MARREIVGIVGLLGWMMIKADCGEASKRPAVRRDAHGHFKNTFLFQ
jgi:hypothetical protein